MNKTPVRLKPIDQRGRTIHVGDWVRFVEIPSDIKELPAETRTMFRRALGKTFRVEAFDDLGHAELDLTKKVAKYNWIWVEPEHLVLFRRKRKGASA